MKINKLSVLSLVFLLVACAPDTSNKPTVEKTGSFYKCVSSVEEATVQPVLNDIKMGEVKYRVIENEPLIPYLTLEEYSKFFIPYFNNDIVTSSVIEDNNAAQWAIRVDGDLVFATTIDFNKKTIIASGGLSSAFKEQTDSSAYLVGSQIGSDILNRNEARYYTSYSYDGFDLDPIVHGGKHYLPLGLLDLTLSSSTNYNVFTSYKEFFVVKAGFYLGLGLTPFYKNEGDTQISNPLYLARDNAVELTNSSYTVTKKVNNVDQEITYPNMPMYLRKYHRNTFYYLFETKYGLKYTRNIKSMKEYFENDARSEDFLSDDPDKRGAALSYLIGNLGDGHTAIRTSNLPTWNEPSYTYRTALWNERINVRDGLTEDRKEAYRQYDYAHATSVEEKEAILKTNYEPDIYTVRYSDDNKLAFYSFDSFAFDPEFMTKEDAYKTDTFKNLLNLFTNLKDGVEDVVIDISTNGGGIIIALLKILALISKDNNAHLGLYDQSTNQQIVQTIRVDSNNDGEYDEKDVYGDDYNIYLLCSPFSFSCGNAYPFMAQRLGFATLLGATSGGGECSVGTSMLPSGQFLSHSSMSRIGDFNPVKNADGSIDHYDYVGVEAGAAPELKYSFHYQHYFDFNYLANLIQTNRA